MSVDSRPVYVLTGPTAAGKKEVAFALARAHDLDVVGMDSVKIYGGLTIGAAAPGREGDGLRIHLVGIADPRTRYSVGRWVEDARACVERIRAEGRSPLFVGGTPLYLQALLRGLFEGPSADAAVRERHEALAAHSGVAALHARLAQVDADAAARILPTDFKRISRALEVFELMGEPISVLQRRLTRPAITGTFHVVSLTAPRAELDRRIGRRVATMLERGLIAEVAGLRDAGMLAGEAAAAIGYREVVEQLEAGVVDAARVRAEIELHTRRLVRKQERWFKRFPEIRPVVRTVASTVEDLARAVAAEFGLPRS